MRRSCSPAQTARACGRLARRLETSTAHGVPVAPPLREPGFGRSPDAASLGSAAAHHRGQGAAVVARHAACAEGRDALECAAAGQGGGAQSRATVHRIWQKYGLQPHRVDTFKFSRDPDFDAKLADVVGLYLDPPERALVLCVDEKIADPGPQPHAADPADAAGDSGPA